MVLHSSDPEQLAATSHNATTSCAKRFAELRPSHQSLARDSPTSVIRGTVSPVVLSPKTPKNSPPRKSRGDDIVTAVLEAALCEVAENGYSAMRVEDVAVRARVNKTTIYRRWPAKSDLVVAAILWAGPQVSDVPDTGDLEQDLRQFLELAATFVKDDVGRCIMVLSFGERNKPEVAKLMRTVDRQMRSMPALMFERAIARGELPADIDVGVVLGALLGSLHSRVVTERLAIDSDFVERLTQLLLHGAKHPSISKHRARLTSRALSTTAHRPAPRPVPARR